MKLSTAESAQRSGWDVHNSDQHLAGEPLYFYVRVHPGEFTQLIIHGSVNSTDAEQQALILPSMCDHVDRMGIALAGLTQLGFEDRAAIKTLNATLSDAVLNYAVRTKTWGLLKPKGVVHFLILAEPSANQSFSFRPVMLPIVDPAPIAPQMLANITETVVAQLKASR